MRNPLGIGMRPGLVFFNHKSIKKYTDRRTARFLSKFGAFVRRSAKSSIKPGGKSNKTSKPGEPPRSHTKALKSGIFFAYNKYNDSVIIGPVIVPTKYGGADALNALEEGGHIMGMIASVSGGGRNNAGQFQKKRFSNFREVKLKIQARPFMKPAFEKEKSKINTIWKSS